jgi:hypothetical protein
MTRMLSRRDRAAIAIALECLRFAKWEPDVAVADAYGILVAGERVAKATRDAVFGAWGIDGRGWRLLRARLALYLRALLRADRGDYGPTEWLGCSCSCDGDRGGWAPRRITPLWALAPAHEVRQ